jgi:hypothetical protein
MKQITLIIAALLFSINSYAEYVTIDKPNPNSISLWSKRIFDDSEMLFQVSNQPCSSEKLLNDGYRYNAMLFLPTESLADKSIAYAILDNGLALVSVGCWDNVSGLIYLINKPTHKPIVFDILPIDETWTKSTIKR